MGQSRSRRRRGSALTKAQSHRAQQSPKSKLEATIKRFRAELVEVESQLAALPPEPRERTEQAEAIRHRESLRRRRLHLQFKLDKLRGTLHRMKQPVGRGKKVVQGPKGGIYTVAQGGSPGLGKRH